MRATLLPLAALLAAVLLACLLLVLRWQMAGAQTVSLDLGDPTGQASQFYPVEHAGDTGFRWSKSLSAVSLPALSNREEVTVKANPARPGGSPGPVHFRLLSGTQLLAEFTAQPGWQTYTATVSLGLRPDLRLLVDSDTFYPSASDRRRLGMAVASFQATSVAGRLGLTWPPYLWFVLALLAPLGAWLLAPLVVKRAWPGVLAVSVLLPLALSLLPPSAALPAASWIVGLLFAASALARAYVELRPGRLMRIAAARAFSSPWQLPLVGLAVALLSLLMTWPLVTRLDNSLPGWPGDNFAFLYKFWWFRVALLHEHRQPLFDPNTFAPFGFNLGQGEPTLLNTLPGVVLGAIFNDVAAYNLLALASFVIAGLGAYLLVREVTGSKPAAFLAALVFAFCPYRLSQFAGHIQLLGTGWIALAFYFTERAFKTLQLRDGALAGLSLALAALSAWYYAYMVGLVLAVYVVVRLLTSRRAVRLRSLVPAFAGALVALVVVAGPVALPSLQLWGQGGLSHTAKAADEHSASPLDYGIPNPLQPLWGQPFMSAHAQQNVIESSLYAGLSVAALATLGWLLRKKGARAPGSWVAWGVVLAVAFVLSLGLTLHGLGGQVQLAGGGSIPLPGQLLFDWLPLFSSMRAYARFGVIAVLAACVLMGLGWLFLCRRFPESAPWLTLLAALMIMVDFWTGPYAWGTSRVVESQTAGYLASAPPGTVMQMPLTSALTGPALFAESFYGKPIAYGYDTFEPPEWSAARPDLVHFPDDRALDVLRRWGVRYIVVSGNAYGADWPGTLAYLKSLPRLRYLNGFNEARTWDVDPQVVDARPDMEEYLLPDQTAVFELAR